MKQDELQNRLDRVISWINNCDQKASILLAFIGVAFPILISADFAIKAYREIISDFGHYLETGEGSFSLVRCFSSLFVVLTTFFIGGSVYYLLNTLSGRVSYSEFKDRGLFTKSLIFFGSISSMEYEEYKKSIQKQSKRENVNDLISQLYINSRICASKFEAYNQALHYLRLGILTLLVTLILLFLI